MKKEEAKPIAIQRANLIIEYITQILSDPQKVEGKIIIDSAKIGNEKMCVINIKVPARNFERHFNTGIPYQHINVFTEQVFQKLINDILYSSKLIRISKLYKIRDVIGIKYANAIDTINNMESKVTINFVTPGDKFFKQADEYNSIIDQILESQEEVTSRKK